MTKTEMLMAKSMGAGRSLRRQEKMNDNLISRAAAIDILDAYQVMVENGEENPYAWARLRMSELPPAQLESIQNNAVHLCDSCQYTYVTCPSHGNDAVFGDGKGNDNICACNKYRPISISAQPIGVQEAYYRGKIDGIKECVARVKKVNEEFANGRFNQQTGGD